MKSFLSILCLAVIAIVFSFVHSNAASSLNEENLVCIDSNELVQLQEALIGEWANSFYPFEISRNSHTPMAGAFLYYRFNEDGTYSKSLGNSEAQLDETGEWEVSADGQYLLMHTDGYENGRKVKKTTKARIKFVRYDEMVLEHSIEVTEKNFCTELKDFYFSKV